MMENENKIAYRKLIVWQKADELAFQIYQATKYFPSEEKFGLVSQMRRSAVSVAANIAEGYTRNSKRDKVHFYNIAIGSLTEIEYYLDFSKRLGYLPENKHQELIKLRSEIGRLLAGLSRKTSVKWLAVFLFLISGLLFHVPAVSAAALYFSPSSGSYAVGSSIVLNVYVSSADQAMNAASGVISFPRDKLEVISLSKTGSILSLWVQEPSFSNSAGTVNFEGIALNPGFTGASGKILTVNFRVKAGGAAALNFLSGSVLANDGQGNNILTSLGTAQFSLGGAVSPGAPETITLTELADTPAAPEISSPTHPDPTKWYALSEAKFTWNVTKDIIGARLLVGRIPTAIPTVTYSTPISSKEISDLADGIWYFFVQLRNAQGWGSVSRFRFQIDTEKPNRFEITEVKREDLTNPHVQFVFDAEDDTSGIDHYEVRIDNQNPEIWQDDGGHIYETAAIEPGKHTLLAKAVDKAGNSLATFVDFFVEALEPPIITDYPKTLASGETLTIRGKTKYPDAWINVFLQHEKDEPKGYLVKSGKDGTFTFVAEERLMSGIYSAWAEVANTRGVKSGPGEKVTIMVERPAFLRIGAGLISFLAIVVPLIALILLLVYLSWHWWHKFAVLRKRARREIREAEHTLHKAFDLPKEAVGEQIRVLEKIKSKRELTEEEEKIIERLKKDLDDAEKLMKNEDE